MLSLFVVHCRHCHPPPSPVTARALFDCCVCFCHSCHCGCRPNLPPRPRQAAAAAVLPPSCRCRCHAVAKLSQPPCRQTCHRRRHRHCHAATHGAAHTSTLLLPRCHRRATAAPPPSCHVAVKLPPPPQAGALQRRINVFHQKLMRGGLQPLPRIATQWQRRDTSIMTCQMSWSKHAVLPRQEVAGTVRYWWRDDVSSNRLFFW